MNVCAVISEYNPFHSGHRYHLEKAREAAHADVILALMSGYYTQRGEAALLSPHHRARMALLGGADLVISLPYTHTVREAEVYARLAVLTLNRLGFVDTLCFGTEEDDLEKLKDTASFMEDRKEAFEFLIKHEITDGKMSYPAAVEAALKKAGKYAPGRDRPNSLLALAYLRALKTTGSGIEPAAVRRLGPYHGDLLSEGYPSASALRAALYRGDWALLKAGMPKTAYRILREQALNGGVIDQRKADQAVITCLRMMDPGQLRACFDIREGMENRLKKAADTCCTASAVVDMCRGPHYTRARVSRMICHCLLGTPLPMPDAPEFVRLWGFTQAAKPLIGRLREAIPCYDSFMKLENEAKGEYNAAKMWYNLSGMPAAAPYHERVITL
ncbi:MAG: nucleotidyltransferase family protein [Clostridia bacterium]|nr:nucleotidyltransferase family protein [Clostridia bacterium]